VADGLELLNEAAVAAASGELDALPSGVVYCEVVCALQALAQYDLAEQWTAAMEAWRHSGGVGSIHGRCRVHRAEILRLRGSLREAEEEALQACEEMRPYVGRELGWPLTELGRIRLRSGDLEGAEQAFRTAHEIGWDPYPGLALVYLAKGEGAAAVHTIRDALERPLNVPSKELPPNTDLRRAPLLAAQVEIETMSEGGDLRLAGAAAEELGDIARTYRSTALEATAAMAHGLVSMAEGEAAAAKQSFDVALQLWSAVGAPYETARARLGLARAHRALGAERRALLELDVARSTFERLGARRDAAIAKRETGAEPVGYGQSPPDGPRGADRRVPGDNVLRREGDHWLVVFDGRSVRVRDLKGLHYLARLVVHPGRELHACDLTGSADGFAALGGSAEAWEDDAPLLDRQAKDAYRRRLEEIDEDLEQARDQGDEERCVQGELERSILARELARAVGLGGRDRRSGSRAERGRVSVTRALRRAIERLREHHAELAEHLHRSVRTGTYCAYLPDPRARCTWKVSDTD
jgi:tetratricopeptide (TPR) repeat protein